MRKNYYRSALFKKYVLYNLCFVLIPVLLLISIYWQNCFKQIITEYETTHRYALKQVMKNVDEKLETIKLMANQLSYDPDLTPYQLQESKYGRYKAISRLKTYHSQANFLDEMILFIRGDSTLYSDKGVMPFDYFLNTRYQLEGWSYGEFYDLIYDTASFGFSPTDSFLSLNGTQRMTVITYPWGNKTGRFGTIIGQIDVNYFEKLLSGIDSEIDNAFFILNQEGELLFSNQNNVKYDFKELSDIILDSNGITTKRIGMTNHSIIALRSEVNNWMYVSVFPNSQFANRLISVKRPVIAFLSAILVICIVSGILLAFRNYIPIHRITVFLRKMIPMKDNAKDRDELKEISSSIHTIISNNEGMKNQIEENRAMLTERFLHRILTRSANYSSDKFSEKNKNLRIDLSGPHYCVIVFKPPRKLLLTERQIVTESIRSLDFDYAHYCIEMDYQGYFAIILNSDMNEVNISKIANTIRETLYGDLNIEPILGIGHTYENVSMISRSFTEAVSAAEATVHSGNYTAFFDELKTQRHSSPYWYPSKAQLRLIQGINQCNTATVEECIMELSELLHTQKLSSDSISLRFIVSGIVQQLWPLVEKNKLDDGEKEIDLLIHYTSINDFLGRLKKLCYNIIAVIESQNKNQQKKVYENILSYIDINYKDQNLSLKGIASRFDMTDSYLSRFFRNNSGVNFIDYITKKRMDEACRLLYETDLLVKDVMEKVGYIDLASFSRKFKQVYGISPGKYRSEKRKKKNVNVAAKT